MIVMENAESHWSKATPSDTGHCACGHSAIAIKKSAFGT